MRKIITLLGILLLAETLSAQVTVIREYYTTTESKKATTPYPDTPDKQERSTIDVREDDERYKKGASWATVEAAVYFNDMMAFEAELKQRLYVIDNVFASIGGGLLFSTTNLTSDISNWRLSGELPFTVGADLFNEWLNLQAGPCLAYAFAGGDKINGEKYSLSDIGAKRTAITFDLSVMLLDKLGVKFKLGDNIEMIGIAYNTSF